MRVGTRVGPISASTSTAGCGTLLVGFILILIPLALIVDYPWEAAGVAVVVVGLVVRSRRRRRARLAASCPVHSPEGPLAAVPEPIDTRLDDLDASYRAGLFTAEEYARARLRLLDEVNE